MGFRVGLAASVVLSALVGCARQELPPLEQARHHFRLGEWSRAVVLCNQLLATEPPSVEALLLRGQARLAQGDAQEAVTDFSAVIQLAPHEPEAFYQRALAYKALGKHDLARDDNRHARAIDNQDAALLRQLESQVPIAKIVLSTPPSANPLAEKAAAEAEILNKTRPVGPRDENAPRELPAGSSSSQIAADIGPNGSAKGNAGSTTAMALPVPGGKLEPLAPASLTTPSFLAGPPLLAPVPSVLPLSSPDKPLATLPGPGQQPRIARTTGNDPPPSAEDKDEPNRVADRPESIRSPARPAGVGPRANNLQRKRPVASPATDPRDDWLLQRNSIKSLSNRPVEELYQRYEKEPETAKPGEQRKYKSLSMPALALARLQQASTAGTLIFHSGTPADKFLRDILVPDFYFGPEAPKTPERERPHSLRPPTTVYVRPNPASP